MLTLHHLENSRSFRIIWLLEEMGLDYELVQHARDSGLGLAPESLQKLHTLGKAPILFDDDRALVESGAIIEYLLDYYGEHELRPPVKTEARQRYNFWLHACEGSAMSFLTLSLVLNKMVSGSPAVIKTIIKAAVGRVEEAYVGPGIDKLLNHVEEQLGESTFFAGDKFTAADIQMGFAMEGLKASGKLGSERPNGRRWLQEVKARPAFRRAQDKGGEMSLPAR